MSPGLSDDPDSAGHRAPPRQNEQVNPLTFESDIAVDLNKARNRMSRSRFRKESTMKSDITTSWMSLLLQKRWIHNVTHIIWVCVFCCAFIFKNLSKSMWHLSLEFHVSSRGSRISPITVAFRFQDVICLSPYLYLLTNPIYIFFYLCF